MSDAAQSRAAAWLQAWDASGVHRCGTPGDAAGADWLAGEARAMGADVAIETFALDRLDPITAYLRIDGACFDGVPLFDAPATDADGISGILGPAGSAAAIGVAELSPQSVYSGEYRALRSSVAHRALVIICAGAEPGLALLNAEQFTAPYGCPTIHVSSEAREAVQAAAARGASVTLVSHSTRARAAACNVVVSIAGSDRHAPTLVVMTPRSSWWQSTAERGGGLVCWLESLRAVLRRKPACNVVFTANSGHELGHTGLDDFVARRPGCDRAGGAVWVHYGANIGAAGGALSLISNDDALRMLAIESLSSTGQTPDGVVPKTQVPSGETRDIHRANGRYVTLVGSNKWFHLPQDRWPHTVDVPKVVRIAQGAAEMASHLSL